MVLPEDPAETPKSLGCIPVFLGDGGVGYQSRQLTRIKARMAYSDSQCDATLTMAQTTSSGLWLERQSHSDHERWL